MKIGCWSRVTVDYYKYRFLCRSTINYSADKITVFQLKHRSALLSYLKQFCHALIVFVSFSYGTACVVKLIKMRARYILNVESLSLSFPSPLYLSVSFSLFLSLSTTSLSFSFFYPATVLTSL